MVRCTASFLIILFCCQLVIGCSSYNYANLLDVAALEVKTNNATLDVKKWSKNEPNPNGPLLLVEVFLIKKKANFVGSIKEETKKIQILSKEKVAPLLQEKKSLLPIIPATMTKGFGNVFKLPTIELSSTQRSQMALTQSTYFLMDFKPEIISEKSGNSFIYDPVVETIESGAFLGIEASFQGDKITITKLSPQLLNILGVRECSTDLPRYTSHFFSWEEPIVFKQNAAILALPIQLKNGDSLLIPMQGKIEQYCANIRGYIPRDKVVEEYKPWMVKNHLSNDAESLEKWLYEEDGKVVANQQFSFLITVQRVKKV